MAEISIFSGTDLTSIAHTIAGRVSVRGGPELEFKLAAKSAIPECDDQFTTNASI